MTPQLVNAGSIRMHYPYDKTADEHFNNLKNQYEDSIERMRNLCDQATDPAEFIRLSGVFCVPLEPYLNSFVLSTFIFLY